MAGIARTLRPSSLDRLHTIDTRMSRLFYHPPVHEPSATIKHLASSRCQLCQRDMLLPTHLPAPDGPSDKLDGWSDDHRRLLDDLEQLLAHARSTGVSGWLPTVDLAPILAGTSLADVLALLGRLSQLIHSLTEQLHQSTREKHALTFELKISQSNLVLAESTVDSLEHAIGRLRRPCSWGLPSEPPTPATSSGGRLRMFSFGKRARPDDAHGSTMLSPVTASAAHPSSPVSATSASSLFLFSSTSPSTSTTASSRSSDSSFTTMLAELEKTRSAHAALQVEYATLQTAHAGLRVAQKRVVEEKNQIENELETLSIALFEEANAMVRAERVRAHKLENELERLRVGRCASPSIRSPRLAEISETVEHMLPNPAADADAGVVESVAGLKPLLLPTALSPKLPSQSFASTPAARRQSLRSPPLAATAVLSQSLRTSRLSQVPGLRRHPGRTLSGSSECVDSRPDSRLSSGSVNSRRTSLVYARTSSCILDSLNTPRAAAVTIGNSSGSRSGTGSGNARRIRGGGVGEALEDDLDQLLLSIVDCAESMGIQGELESMFGET